MSHKPLRLHLARLELQGTQESQKHMHASILSPNPKMRIMAILDQFRDKAARPVQTRFLEIWFSDDTDSKTKLCGRLKEQLALLCSKNLFHDINEKTKDPKLKDKAEMLVEALKTCLLPSNNAQIKACEKPE